MITRLRSHSRGRGSTRRARASSGPGGGSDPAAATAAGAAGAAAGRRAFGDASNRNSKKGGKGGSSADGAKRSTRATATGRTLRNSTSASTAASAVAAAAAASAASSSAASNANANAQKKTGKRGREAVAKAKAEEENSKAPATRRSTRRTSNDGTEPEPEPERTSTASRSRVTRSSSRGRSKTHATKRRATDEAPPGAETTSAKRAKTSKKKKAKAPAVRAKKEPTTEAAAAVARTRPTRSASRTRTRAQDAASVATVALKSEVKSEEEDASAAADELKPRSLADDFLVPPQYRLERASFDGKNHTLGMAPQDVEEDEDVLKAAPYVADMFQHLYVAEERDMPTVYMDDQPDINAKMRAILVDWLVEVHMKFRLVPETLYLCVNLIDRYCNLVEVKRSRLQLVGVTALLIACKYEEIYPPEVRDCVYITDRAYTRQDVLDMEQDILEKLAFRITVPTAYPFLLRFLNMVEASELVTFAANYYMERTLQEHDLLEYRPSVVCAAAVVLALNNPSIREDDDETGDAPGLPKVLTEYTGFDEAELLEVAEIISRKVKEEPVTASRRQLIAVKKKFDHDKYRHVSVDFDDPSHRDIKRKKGRGGRK